MGGLAFPDANFGGCSLASIHEKAAIYDAIATAASLDEARRVYKERFLMVYPLHKVIQNELYRLAKKSDDIDRWKASRVDFWTLIISRACADAYLTVHGCLQRLLQVVLRRFVEVRHHDGLLLTRRM